MKPVISPVGHIVANCPDCGVRTTFEYRSNDDEYEFVEQFNPHFIGIVHWSRVIYMLVRCAG
jgi:hypothetical protein